MASNHLTVVPNAYGARFARLRVKGPLWYERAARRYVGNLARRYRWLWTKPCVDVLRDPARRAWEIHISWDAANNPTGGPSRELTLADARLRNEEHGGDD